MNGVTNTTKSGIPAEARCFFRDGDKLVCVLGDFVNVQESPAGFGDTYEDAMDDLIKSMQAEVDRLAAVIAKQQTAATA